MAVALTIVDSFTSKAFAGNPAAVCLLVRPAPEPWMRAVAAEVNLSETAFVVPRTDGDHDLRWFTPTVEVDLCGHATLAAAHVLGGSGRFHTRSGVLTCTSGSNGEIEMDLPADPTVPAPIDGWASALGLDDEAVIAAGTARSKWALVEVRTADDVRAVVLDRQAVIGLGGSVIVAADTAADPTSPFDVVSRAFAPGAGIDEDPVTGSAHCVLGPWLSSRHGRDRFAAHQASARGGDVGVHVRGDRVTISGSATTVLRGEVVADPG